MSDPADAPEPLRRPMPVGVIALLCALILLIAVGLGVTAFFVLVYPARHTTAPPPATSSIGVRAATGLRAAPLRRFSGATSVAGASARRRS